MEMARRDSPTPMLSGWGRIPRPGREVLSEDLRALTREAVLSRGLGRSYGDSSLPPPGQLDVATTRLGDRILGFDDETGLIRVEAGLSLKELNRLFLPRRWFTPVTPGTQFVTVGGMAAADIHGKNHHVEGTFGAHVAAIVLRVADGRVLEVTPEREPELFWATIGGMGLTGHILEVAFRMARIPSPWIYEERERFSTIDALLEGLDRAAAGWPMTVAWVDTMSTGKKLGRGIVNRGRWASPDEAPSKPPPNLRRFAVPFDCPHWLLNKWAIRAFNACVFQAHVLARPRVVHPETFFYPLDTILHWNRLYGRRGFTQYQCVLPDAAGPDAVRRFLEVLHRAGGADSFLSVIKDCAAEGRGLLSFPLPGISVALDLAVGAHTQKLVDTLNDAVSAEGGRVYLAKDAFTRPDHFRAMEPRLEAFMRVRRQWDPELKIRSAQSVRILEDPP